MKPIFNSLGSNYSFKFALISVQQIFCPKNDAKNETIELLKNILGFEVNKNNIVFTYKGRDAIDLAIRSYGLSENDEILTQAFTCFSIEEAIMRAGAKPRYVDIDDAGLNLTVEKLESAYSQAKNCKAVLVQHSLGHPAEIEKIAHWAKNKGLILIEDLAQSIGGTDESGQPLGFLADAVILSFGRDKIVDGISGGAVIFKCVDIKVDKKLSEINFVTVVKDLIYPMTTWKIRNFYNFGIGKILHFFSKKIKLIDSPIKSEYNEIKKLPKNYFAGITIQLQNLHRSLAHRRKIAGYYYKNLQNIVGLDNITTQKDIKFGSNLRYAINVENPNLLANKLKKKNIFLKDRWYRDAVDFGEINCQSIYRSGSCPNAEKMSKKIFNLPTHYNINLNDAKKIVKEIKDEQLAD